MSFLLTVATQGLAVLGVTLAARDGAAWLLIAAVAALLLGLAFYVVTVTRFALPQLLTGRGDQWVAVFPLGMYAACSFALGQVTGVTGISAFARGRTWLAVTVSLVVFGGLIRRSWQVCRDGPATPLVC